MTAIKTNRVKPTENQMWTKSEWNKTESIQSWKNTNEIRQKEAQDWDKTEWRSNLFKNRMKIRL